MGVVQLAVETHAPRRHDCVLAVSVQNLLELAGMSEISLMASLCLVSFARAAGGFACKTGYAALDLSRQVALE